MLIIWMQTPFDPTLPESECRSECIHHYRQLSSCISDVIWLLQAKAVTVCAEQLQKCHAPAPHSPVNKELSLLFLFLAQHKPTDPCSVLLQHPAPLSSPCWSRVTTVTTLPCVRGLTICLSAPNKMKKNCHVCTFMNNIRFCVWIKRKAIMSHWN